MVWAVAQSIGEMAVMYPLPSAFVQWASMFVDPAADFALGWAYWFNYWIIIANELQGAVTVLQFWNKSVPVVAWITIWWAVVALVNFGPIRVFGEIEVTAAAIKFGWIFVVIIACLVITCGGGPNHESIGFRYWSESAFTHGFKGFLAVMPTCIFAMSGSENSGMVAAETANPRKSVPFAVNSMWIRLTVFYLIGSFMVSLCVSPYNPNLFDGEGTNASPFFIAFEEAGIHGLAHAMNAIIFLSVISNAPASTYAGSRTLVGLAQVGMAPKVSLLIPCSHAID